MSVKVNPPPQHPLPQKIIGDPELSPFFRYQQEYLFKLWQRTGGGTDLIFNVGEGLDELEDRVTRFNFQCRRGFG
jgi:hypothetical protein